MSFLESLPKWLANYLEKNNIKTPEQAITTSDEHYLRFLNLPMDCVFILKRAAASLILPESFVDAHQIYEKENFLGKLSTGCSVIDEYLQGGLRPCTIVEIFGESGCGKTQIALQIASHCWKKGAVYISTEDVFPSKRLQQIFSYINNIQDVKQEITKYGEKLFILELIEWEELKHCIKVQLPRLLKTNEEIKLIVIDSIAAPFRSEFQNDMKSRARHLKEIGVALMNLATKYNLLVLCINQVLSTLDSGENDVIPCLGLTWSNLLTSRIKVEKTDRYCRPSAVIHSPHTNTNDSLVQIREMTIVSSPELASTESIKYIITCDGVTGLR